MSVELMFEFVVMLVGAVLVSYGLWAWRRGRVTRKSTKAAIVFGCIAVVSALAVDVLTDFLTPDKHDALGFVVTVVAGLLSFLCLIALAAAIVSLIVRAVTRRPADTPPAAVSYEPQPPSV
jgi:hypothetical protein